MVTRFVRIQLIVFTALTIVAALLITFVYVRVPSLLGFGRIEVTADFSNTGGLYPNANVTYRGYTVGKVREIDLVPGGVRATLSIDDSLLPPRDSRLEVHSVSAIGEQYVDFVPSATPGDAVADGDAFGLDRTSTPAPIAHVLDDVDNLATSLNPQSLETVLTEAAKAFDGLGPDLGRLADNTQKLLTVANENYGPTEQLIRDAPRLLDAIRDSDPSTRQWAGGLSSFTGRLAASDGDIRAMLRDVPSPARRAGDLLNELNTTAPTLLSSADVLAKLAKDYHAPIEQILVFYPLLTVENLHAAPEYQSPGTFRFNLGTDVNPPACMEGWVPEGEPGGPRVSSDVTDEILPPNSYCKLPQDDQRITRGARNLPCFEPGSPPGRRAPTIQECRGNGFQPTAERGVYVPSGTSSGLSRIAVPEGPLFATGATGTPAPDAKEMTWQGLLIAPTQA
jgi:phospholipid/cholesterol/gamma-HCH transport system substrate-binding protein